MEKSERCQEKYRFDVAENNPRLVFILGETHHGQSLTDRNERAEVNEAGNETHHQRGDERLTTTATDDQISFFMPEHEVVFRNRRFFAKPKARSRRYHLHTVELASAFWYEHLAFRDALRSDQKLARDYERLKRELAVRCGYERQAYTDGKDPFVRPILERICGVEE